MRPMLHIYRMPHTVRRSNHVLYLARYKLQPIFGVRRESDRPFREEFHKSDIGPDQGVVKGFHKSPVRTNDRKRYCKYIHCMLADTSSTCTAVCIAQSNYALDDARDLFVQTNVDNKIKFSSDSKYFSTWDKS